LSDSRCLLARKISPFPFPLLFTAFVCYAISPLSPLK
jgi:hypothetical protein